MERADISLRVGMDKREFFPFAFELKMKRFINNLFIIVSKCITYFTELNSIDPRVLINIQITRVTRMDYKLFEQILFQNK